MLFFFKGRVGRLTYIGYILAVGIVAASIIGGAIFRAIESPDVSVLEVMVGNVAAFVWFWSNIALTAKWMHDIGYSALHLIWIVVLCFGAMLGYMLLATQILSYLALMALALWLLLAPSQSRVNRFGAVPA